MRGVEGFARQLDKYVWRVWLPKQNARTRVLLTERAWALGAAHARPFTTSGYTDDYKFAYVGPELLAVGTLIWRTMCKRANYWLSAKANAGTVLDYIGGREILNGGYGCVNPSKHARAIADSTAGPRGQTPPIGTPNQYYYQRLQ